MTALSRARATGMSKPIRTLDALVGADVKIYKGGLHGFKGGYLVPWVDNDPDIAHPCIAIPELADYVDNTGGAAGAQSCPVDFQVEKICYLFANDTVSALGQTHVGGSAWGIDNQTVSADSGGGARSRVGTPWIISGSNSRGYRTGVYVEFDGTGAGGGSPAEAESIFKVSVTVTEATLTAAVNGTAQEVNIGSPLPANARIVGRNIKLATPFTGGSATAVTVDIGSSGDTDAIVAGANVFAAAVDGQASSMPNGIAPNKAFATSTQLIATFTPDASHTLAGLTAGACTIEVLYAVLA